MFVIWWKSNVCVIAVPEGLESGNWKETIFEKIIAENYSTLKKDVFKDSYQPQAVYIQRKAYLCPLW